MRSFFIGLLAASLVSNSPVIAQQACYSFDYQQRKLRDEPGLAIVANQVEQFIQTNGSSTALAVQTTSRGTPVITIPVVVHVLYNKASENISEGTIQGLIKTLNLCYRKLHPDTIKTPVRFAGLSADCEIEFKLAVSDPRQRATNGILRKYTAVSQWDIDDRVKSSALGGDDPWDAKSYLNIWICNLRYVSGYSSIPGDAAAKDGVVLAGGAMGKTVVHEVGHWLGLKHIWGDQYCGDDGVADTPPQSTGTPGCPSGIRISCNNGPNGDMYMNYMDVTGDACVNMFTQGQKQRMLALFKPGGLRYSLFASHGLKEPLYQEIPLPAQDTVVVSDPETIPVLLYPNPAIREITLDLGDTRQWVGKMISICNAQGLTVMQQTLHAKTQKIDIGQLRAGVYFILGKGSDGQVFKQKFLKIE